MSTTTTTTTPASHQPGASAARPERENRMGVGTWLATVGWRHLIAILVIIVTAFPLVYVLSASLNPSGTMTGSNELFTKFDLANYVNLFHNPQQPYGQWYLNTLYVGFASAIGTVFLGALAAYAFSRMRFKGRRPGLLSLLLVQMFPQMLAFIAIFLLLSNVGTVFPALGLGSKTALIMVYLGGALGVNTWLMYGFFNTVPVSLDEAARVDGAGHARIFFTIILPLVTPSLAVTALLSFISSINEYVIASMVLTDTHNYTLAVGLYQFVSQKTESNWPLFSAGAVLAALPVLVIFFALQRYIVAGLTSGAVK